MNRFKNVSKLIPERDWPVLTPVSVAAKGQKFCDECGHVLPQEKEKCISCGAVAIMFVDRKKPKT